MKKILAILAGILTLSAMAFLGGCKEEIDTTKVIPEGTFEILTPVAESADVAVNVSIAWTAEPNATSYHVALSKEEDFTSVTNEATVEGLSWTVTNSLDYEMQYYLRVTALKEGESGSVALARKKTVFKTIAEHNTASPDYTKTRTLYDFEDFDSTEALVERFQPHTAGTPIDVSLTQTGVEGSKAMQFSYNPDSNGWGGVLSSLPSEKKVWSGTKGIRFWVNGEGSGNTLEIRFGKRGYQSWNAMVTLNAKQGEYITIPYTAFADNGGGDGILDLSGITRLWFFITGPRAANITIDDVTIGSTEEYSTDTRYKVEKSLDAPIGVFEDFEGYADGASVQQTWTFEGMTSVTLDTTSAFGGERTLAVTPNAGWSTVGISLPYTDFSKVASIRFKGSAATYVLQLISGYNVVEKQFSNVKSGEETGVNVSELLPQNSSMTFDVTKIDLFRIGIKDQAGNVVKIDDITFSEEALEEAGGYGEGHVEDFENYATLNEVKAVWSFETTIASAKLTNEAFSGNQSLVVTPNSGWTMLGMKFDATDFTAIKAITFKASAGNYVVKVIGNWKTMEAEITCSADGAVAGVNLADLTPQAGATAEEILSAVDQVYIGIKDKNGIAVTFDDITFSKQTFEGGSSEEEGDFLEDFEGYASVEAVKAVWKFDTIGAVALTDQAYSGSKSLVVTPTSGWAMFGMEMQPTDFSQLKAITFKASAGTYVVKVIGNWKTLEAEITCSADGEITGVNLVDLVATGDAVAADVLSAVDQIWIGVKDKNGVEVKIDDICFSSQEIA